VAVLREDLEDPTGQPETFLDGLVGVGVGSEDEDPAAIALARELATQEVGCVRLREDPALEVEPRRESEVRVRLARETVDAAVLAALVRIDRLFEGNVGRVVGGDQASGGLGGDDRLEGRRLDVEATPAVVEGNDLADLEPPRRVTDRAATFAGLPPRSTGFVDYWRLLATSSICLNSVPSAWMMNDSYM
jgi:hypothetical protein